MPISATGTSSRKARRLKPGALHSGFTLIEILVVVVIIAIVASVAVISVNALGRDTEISDETRRLVGLIGMVREQAEMEGRDYGLRLEEERYDFMLFDVRRNDWLPIAEDRLLRPRELPAGLRFMLRIEGRDLVLRPPADRKKPRPPHIVMLSSGDLTAFEMRIQREDSDHESFIDGKVDGELVVRTVDEAAP